MPCRSGISKHLIETGLQCYSKNFSLRLLLKSVITKVLLYKVGLKLKFKSVWVAMCSLVISLNLCDFLIKCYAKQKQPGCKKMRGQSEATMVMSDQQL